MSTAHAISGDAEAAARIARESFQQWTVDFRRFTLEARVCFETRDWRKLHQDSVDRLALYQQAVDRSVAMFRGLFGRRARDKAMWQAVKAAYFREVTNRGDVELAETFFGSITRRVFGTVGVDPAIEFVDPLAPVSGLSATITRDFRRTGTLVGFIRDILSAYTFAAPYADLEHDSALAAQALEAVAPAADIQGAELLTPVFFRNKGAYLVGRVRTSRGSVPMVIALLHEDATGVTVDAVLLNEDEVSIVFSFARSYFFVDTEHPRELVAFLRSIMPRKPVADLYIAIGHNKHAKTEIYRDLRRHLETSEERFEFARGARGMVMIVFTMPSYDVVIKVLRDRFEYPKTTTRQEVRDKYHLVFAHDRAGRLVDAQEFEYLEFERARFSESLLDELMRNAGNTVSVQGQSVVIKHLYTERRVTPLDIYLQESPESDARQAILDYGAAVRDLAATDIFPGDLLLKNFGVTRHGRVVFYDYDELCRVTECNFRPLPEATDDSEALSGEPWFYVGPRDIFPEEFQSFLGLQGELLQLFVSTHGCLLELPFWRCIQERLRASQVIDLFPYPSSKRLPGRASHMGTLEPKVNDL